MSGMFGVDGFDTAKKCFAENTASHMNDEYYNLYNGLYHLVVGMERMQAEINALRAEVSRLQQGR